MSAVRFALLLLGLSSQACLAAEAVAQSSGQGSVSTAGSLFSVLFGLVAVIAGLVLASLSVDFAWAVTDATRRGASLDIGLLGLPLNAGLAVLHTRLADHAARIRFEIQQTPADPAISLQGALHA
jgi:hypothetical protein